MNIILTDPRPPHKKWMITPSLGTCYNIKRYNDKSYIHAGRKIEPGFKDLPYYPTNLRQAIKMVYELMAKDTEIEGELEIPDFTTLENYFMQAVDKVTDSVEVSLIDGAKSE